MSICQDNGCKGGHGVEHPKCWSCGTTNMETVAPGARNFIHRPGCAKLEVPRGP